MQMGLFAYLNNKLKENGLTFIWYQICQSMLNIEWDMLCFIFFYECFAKNLSFNEYSLICN